MKPESQVKHKLAQVRFRHLKREVRNGLSRKSGNCKHNGVVELPVYGQGQIGICLYGASNIVSWNGGACDDSLGERAAKCSLFECSNSKEQLKAEFDEFLKSSDRAHVAARYPDMAALLWVLDLDGPDLDPALDPPSEEESSPEEAASVEKPSPEEAASVASILKIEDERILNVLDDALKSGALDMEDDSDVCKRHGTLEPCRHCLALEPSKVESIAIPQTGWGTFFAWWLGFWVRLVGRFRNG